jgi:hypothetical protein
MEGIPKLWLMLHGDVTSGKVDGLRVFNGDELVGEIELLELERIYANWRKEMATQDVEQRHATSTT